MFVQNISVFSTEASFTNLAAMDLHDQYFTLFDYSKTRIALTTLTTPDPPDHHTGHYDHRPNHPGPQTPAKPATKGRGRRGKASLANESVQVTNPSRIYTKCLVVDILQGVFFTGPP